MRAGGAAQAAAGDFAHFGAAARQHGAVDADFAKFVDDHRPDFIGWLMRQQMQQGPWFARAQKAGEQIDGVLLMRVVYSFGKARSAAHPGGAVENRRAAAALS